MTRPHAAPLRRRPLALALCLLAAPAGAAPPVDEVRFSAWGARELALLNRRPHFLDRAELLALPVAPPPGNAAASTRAELDELLRLQAARTPAERAAIERHRSYPGLCAELIAALHRRPGALPKTQALLDHVERDLVVAVFHAKRRFERPRPHQLEPRLKPSIPVPAHPAYPSGHALQGHVAARVLALLAPAARDALLAVGERIGREREIAGIHFPSDSAASRLLGDALFARLERSPRFRAELEAARAEWPRRDQPPPLP